MKIGFLLCSPEINGGTNVILEHGAGLKACDHQVSIITQQVIAPEEYAWHPKGHQLRWCTFAEAMEEQFDCLIATWWESPYLLHRFNAKQYAYFVQSIESRFFEEDEPANMDLRDHSVGATRCDHGYFFTLPMITEATWIKHYLEENCNQKPYLVRNGIRKELYSEGPVLSKKPAEGLRVLIEGPVDVFHKNVPKTIALCREAGVKEIWLLTSSSVPGFEGVDRVFSQIPLEQTPPIYRSCHLLVKLSAVEGMFGPPLEMFHCGGTAIVYDVTGHDEYIEHEGNGLVVKQDDEAQVIEDLKMLSDNPGYLERLCQGATDTAVQWPDWQQSSQEFEAALQAIMGQPHVRRQYLQNISTIFMSYQSLQLETRELQRHAEREGGARDITHHNFVQAYALATDKIIDQTWGHYVSGKPATLACNLSVTAQDIQIRLDPSVRIGIICLHKILLTAEDGEELVSYTTASFDHLFITGTAQWLTKRDDFWVIQSYGNDPQIFLPRLQSWPGDTVKIEITLRELGIKQYISELEEQDPPGQRRGRLLSSLRKVLGS